MEALAIVILILGVLALLAFSPWFRRFALVCAALFIVAAGVGYMKIHWENEQAMAQNCVTEPSIDQWGPKEGDVDLAPEIPWKSGTCIGWLDDHPQAKAERKRAIEQVMAQKCPAILARDQSEPGYMPPVWGSIAKCKQWLAEQNNNQEK